MADSGHPPAELHERLLICRTIKLNAGALGGHRRCCHAKMQKNAQNKPQIARIILCVHTTLQVYCNLFLTFCAPLTDLKITSSQKKIKLAEQHDTLAYADDLKIARAHAALFILIKAEIYRKCGRYHRYDINVRRLSLLKIKI